MNTSNNVVDLVFKKILGGKVISSVCSFVNWGHCFARHFSWNDSRIA